GRTDQRRSPPLDPARWPSGDPRPAPPRSAPCPASVPGPLLWRTIPWDSSVLLLFLSGALHQTYCCDARGGSVDAIKLQFAQRCESEPERGPREYRLRPARHGRRHRGQLDSGAGRGHRRSRGTLPVAVPVFAESRPHLVVGTALEEAPPAVRGVPDTLRVPRQMLLHLDERVLLAKVLADERAVPLDDTPLVVAPALLGERVEGLAEDPRTAHRGDA